MGRHRPQSRSKHDWIPSEPVYGCARQGNNSRLPPRNCSMDCAGTRIHYSACDVGGRGRRCRGEEGKSGGGAMTRRSRVGRCRQAVAGDAARPAERVGCWAGARMGGARRRRRGGSGECAARRREARQAMVLLYADGGAQNMMSPQPARQESGWCLASYTPSS